MDSPTATKATSTSTFTTTTATSHQLEDANGNMNEVLVVLQTENGEEIALPISALPSEFVTSAGGTTTQVIMVEDEGVPEPQEEVTVETTTTTHEGEIIQTGILEHQHEPQDQPDVELEVTAQQSELLTHHEPAQTITLMSTTPPEIPETQNAPSLTYDPISTQATDPVSSTGIHNVETAKSLEPIVETENSILQNVAHTHSETKACDDEGLEVEKSVEKVTEEPEEKAIPIIPTPNRRRKSEISIRPMNEEDVLMEFQEILSYDDDSHSICKKSSRTPKKKKRHYVRKSKLSDYDCASPPKKLIDEKKIKAETNATPVKDEKTEVVEAPPEKPSTPAPTSPTKTPASSPSKSSLDPLQKSSEASPISAPSTRSTRALTSSKVSNEPSEPRPTPPELYDTASCSTRGQRSAPTKDTEVSETADDEKVLETHSLERVEEKPEPDQNLRVSERARERRVALSQSSASIPGTYKCSECGFSTRRLNNLVAHMKDTCTYAKKRWQNEVEKFKTSCYPTKTSPSRSSTSRSKANNHNK